MADRRRFNDHRGEDAAARLGTAALIVAVASVVGLIMPPQRAAAEDLVEIYQAALENDPELAAARATVDLGEARYRNAILRYFPRAFAVLEGSRQRDRVLDRDDENTVLDLGGARFNSAIATVSVTQPIVDFERIAFARRELTARDVAVAEFAAARQELVIKVTRRYLEALAAGKRVSLLQAALDGATEELRRAAAAEREALISVAELRSVEAAALLARAELFEAQAGFENALEAIGELTGTRPKSVDEVAGPVPTLPPQPNDPDDWVTRALVGSPNLRVQALRVLEAERQRDELFAKNLPRIELVGSYDYRDEGDSTFGGGSVEDEATLGVRVRIPLFNADGEGYEFLQASERQRIEQFELDKARRTVEREVRNFFRLVTNAEGKIDALRAAVEARRAAEANARRLQEAGVASFVDVLNAQRERLRAERDAFDAELRYLLDRFSLLSLTGGIAEGHVAELNSVLMGGASTADAAAARAGGPFAAGDAGVPLGYAEPAAPALSAARAARLEVDARSAAEDAAGNAAEDAAEDATLARDAAATGAAAPTTAPLPVRAPKPEETDLFGADFGGLPAQQFLQTDEASDKAEAGAPD